MRFKIVTIMSVMLVSLALLAGCADVPSSAPPPIEVNSEYRFLNADPGITASITFDLDEAPAVSGLAYTQATEHAVYPAGSRVGEVNDQDTIRVAMTTDQRGTIVLLPMTESFREVVKLVERRIFDPNEIPNPRIRVAHAASNAGAAGPAVDVEIVGADTTVSASNIAFRGASNYLTVYPGTYAVNVYAAGDTTVILSTNVEVSNTRYTSVVVGDVDAGSLQFVNLTDN